MGVRVAISHDSCIGYVRYVPHIEALKNPEKVVWSKFIETKMMLPESCVRSWRLNCSHAPKLMLQFDQESGRYNLQESVLHSKTILCYAKRLIFHQGLLTFR